MPRVLLIRHALSEWNVAGRWQGQADPPLSEEGRAQARSARDGAGEFDLAVTSDLQRAVGTATELAPGVRQLAVVDLREYDVGEWSGRTWPEIEAGWGDQLALFREGRLEGAPGGERRTDFDDRVRRAARRVAEVVTEAGAARILVVSHGGVVRALARMQTGVDRHVGHLAGYTAEVKGGDLVVGEPLDLLAAAARRTGPVDRMAL